MNGHNEPGAMTNISPSCPTRPNLHPHFFFHELLVPCRCHSGCPPLPTTTVVVHPSKPHSFFFIHESQTSCNVTWKQDTGSANRSRICESRCRGAQYPPPNHPLLLGLLHKDARLEQKVLCLCKVVLTCLEKLGCRYGMSTVLCALFVLGKKTRVDRASSQLHPQKPQDRCADTMRLLLN